MCTWIFVAMAACGIFPGSFASSSSEVEEWPNPIYGYTKGDSDGLLPQKESSDRDFRYYYQLVVLQLLLVHHGSLRCGGAVGGREVALEETIEAVKHFQSTHGMEKDAMHLGEVMWTSLVVEVKPDDKSAAVAAFSWLNEAILEATRAPMWDDEKGLECEGVFDNNLKAKLMSKWVVDSAWLQENGVPVYVWRDLLMEPEARLLEGCVPRSFVTHIFGAVWMLAWLAFAMSFAIFHDDGWNRRHLARLGSLHQQEGCRRRLSFLAREMAVLPAMAISHGIATIGVWTWPSDLATHGLIACQLAAGVIALARLATVRHGSQSLARHALGVLALTLLTVSLYYAFQWAPELDVEGVYEAIWLIVPSAILALLWYGLTFCITDQHRVCRSACFFFFAGAALAVPLLLSWGLGAINTNGGLGVIRERSVWVATFAPSGIFAFSMCCEKFVPRLVEYCEYTAETQWLLAMTLRTSVELARLQSALVALYLAHGGNNSWGFWNVVLNLSQSYFYETLTRQTFLTRSLTCTFRVGDSSKPDRQLRSAFTAGEIVLTIGADPWAYRYRAALLPVELAVIAMHLCQLFVLGIPAGFPSGEWIAGVTLQFFAVFLREGTTIFLARHGLATVPKVPITQLPGHLLALMLGIGMSMSSYAQVSTIWFLYAHHWAACFGGHTGSDVATAGDDAMLGAVFVGFLCFAFFAMVLESFGAWVHWMVKMQAEASRTENEVPVMPRAWTDKASTQPGDLVRQFTGSSTSIGLPAPVPCVFSSEDSAAAAASGHNHGEEGRGFVNTNNSASKVPTTLNHGLSRTWDQTLNSIWQDDDCEHIDTPNSSNSGDRLTVDHKPCLFSHACGTILPGMLPGNPALDESSWLGAARQPSKDLDQQVQELLQNVVPKEEGKLTETLADEKQSPSNYRNSEHQQILAEVLEVVQDPALTITHRTLVASESITEEALRATAERKDTPNKPQFEAQRLSDTEKILNLLSSADDPNDVSNIIDALGTQALSAVGVSDSTQELPCGIPADIGLMTASADADKLANSNLSARGWTKASVIATEQAEFARGEPEVEPTVQIPTPTAAECTSALDIQEQTKQAPFGPAMELVGNKCFTQEEEVDQVPLHQVVELEEQVLRCQEEEQATFLKIEHARIEEEARQNAEREREAVEKDKLAQEAAEREQRRIERLNQELVVAIASRSVEQLESFMDVAKSRQVPDELLSLARQSLQEIVHEEHRAAAEQALQQAWGGAGIDKLRLAIGRAKEAGVAEHQISLAMARLDELLAELARREAAATKLREVANSEDTSPILLPEKIQALESAIENSEEVGVAAAELHAAKERLFSWQMQKRCHDATVVMQNALMEQDVEAVKKALMTAQDVGVDASEIARVAHALQGLIDEVAMASNKEKLLAYRIEQAMAAKNRAERAGTSHEVEQLLGEAGVTAGLRDAIQEARKTRMVKHNTIARAESVLAEVTADLKRILADKRAQEKKAAESRLRSNMEGAKARPIGAGVLETLRKHILEAQMQGADTREAEALLIQLTEEYTKLMQAAQEDLDRALSAKHVEAVGPCIEQCKLLQLTDSVSRAMFQIRGIITEDISAAWEMGREGRLAAIERLKLLVDVLRSNGDKQVRQFHNELQDLKGALRVFCRVRPLNSREQKKGDSIAVDILDPFTVAVQKGEGERQIFSYDAIFGPSTTQGEVFSECKSMVQSAIDGYNVTVFTYGQTGAGKTWTLYGSGQEPGISPRLCEEIFRLVERDSDKLNFSLKASMIELYCNDLRDLLTRSKDAPKIELKSTRNPDGSTWVRLEGATETVVKSSDDLALVVATGLGNRKVRATQMNADSSRSHLSLIISLEIIDKATGRLRSGKISIVDLAGSERLSKSGATGEGQKEAIEINKSLTALGDVMMAFTSKAKLIPYRNHKLTQLMQDSLGGTAKTLMFVNVSPSASNADETINSLKYASRARCIENEVHGNQGTKPRASMRGH